MGLLGQAGPGRLGRHLPVNAPSAQVGRYQTTMFAQLDPDVELDPHVVLLDDPRWQSCVDELQNAKWIGLDTEFYGPNGPWAKRKSIDYWKSFVRLIQVGLPSGLVMVFELGGMLDDRPLQIARHSTHLLVLRSVIEDRTVPKVGMALLTEYMLLRIHFGWKMRCMRDIMLMSQVIWAGVGSKPKRYIETGIAVAPMLKHNMASICERLGIPVDKTEQQSDWAQRMTNRQLNYAARDVIVPRLAWIELTRLARNEGLMNTFEAECSAQPAFCECEYNGLPIDLEIARADLSKWEEVRDGFFAPFKEVFPGVNPSSPAQVAEVLTNALDVYKCPGCNTQYDPLLAKPKGAPIPDDWKCACWKSPIAQSGLVKPSKPIRMGVRRFFERKLIRGKAQDQPTTSDEVLAEYADVWYVRSLLEGRSTATCMNWLKAAVEHSFDSGTGPRIRADFQQIAGGYQEHGSAAGESGRGMGRSSASRPINTQNPSNLQPEHEKAGAVSVRRSIRPAADRAFVVADLSQAHARIAAQWSKDPVMLRDFNAGRDYHLAMTHRLVAIKVQPGLTFEEAEIVAASKAHPLHKEFKARRQGCKSTNYAKLNLSGVMTLKMQMETMAVPIHMSDEEVAQLIQTWNELYAVLYRAQRSHIRQVNSHNHTFKNIGVEGVYGESRGLTGRRLFLVKEWKPPRERDDGTMREGYWSVKATDAVSFVWMGTEADIIKRAMGKLVDVFDEHPEWDVRWSNMAHDELDLDCREEHALAVATATQKEMHDAMRWAGIVDLPVDEAGASPEKLIKSDWGAK